MPEEDTTVNIALQDVEKYGSLEQDKDPLTEKQTKANVAKNDIQSRWKNLGKKTIEENRSKKIMEQVHNTFNQARKIDDTHIVISKGETEIHVQIFEASELTKLQDDINPMWYSAVKFTSWIIFILFLGISAVIKFSLVLVPTMDVSI